MIQNLLVIGLSFAVIRLAVGLKNGSFLRKALGVASGFLMVSSLLPLTMNGYNTGMLYQLMRGSWLHAIAIAAFGISTYFLLTKKELKSTFLSMGCIIISSIAAMLGIFYGPLSSINQMPFQNSSSETSSTIYLILYFFVPLILLIGHTCLWISESQYFKSEFKKYFP